MRRHYGRNMVACSILCQHSYWSALDRQNLFKQLLQPGDNEIIQARSKKMQQFQFFSVTLKIFFLILEILHNIILGYILVKNEPKICHSVTGEQVYAIQSKHLVIHYVVRKKPRLSIASVSNSFQCHLLWCLECYQLKSLESLAS